MAREVSPDRYFRDLYDAYGSLILTYFKRRTDSETAKDCAAETFLVAWRRLDDIPADARPWLYGVARWVHANQRRRSGRTGRLVAKLAGQRPDAPPSPEVVVLRRAEEAELVDAVKRLRPTDRDLLLLATWEELPHAQIGEILGCSAHAVDQRIYRAVQRLARELRPAGQKQREATTPATESGAEQR
jgi:RNA polymerase sigma-70 factor (ECF subfamily)